MLKRHALSAAVVLALVLAAFALFHRTAGAQARRAPTFDRVEVVTYASGLTGFFDRDTGALYVYDSKWDKCVAVRKLTALGAPMLEVSRPRR